jgi:Concanavalin A-like lectin/glucanases superfamily
MKTFLTILAVCIAFFAHAITGDSTNCVPLSGLVSWWPGESNAVDVVDGNTGVLLNGATFAPGKIGTAFSLDGSGAHVRIADNVNLHLTNGLTLEAWVYPTNLVYAQQIISKWDAVYRYQKSYGTWLASNGQFIFSVCAKGDEYVGPSAVVVSVNTVPLNQWTHVAATYDGSTLNVYLNGQLENQAAFPYGIFAGTNDLGIGAVVGGIPAGEFSYPFSGLIDEPAIYNRALSAAEIQGIYSGSIGKCQPPPTISLGLYPGLTINASAGQTVAIQYVTSLASSNWITITSLTITNVPQLWIDAANNVSTGDHPQRFYRAVLVP